MLTIKVAPSILSADFTRLGEDVQSVLSSGADYIHVDVMDGVFVPNITIGVPVVKSLRKAFPETFLDVHLMVTRPGRYVDPFCDAGASLLTFHVEADEPQNITEALERTRARGVKTCLGLKPRTPAALLTPWLEELDMALVMTVEPGFGGQSFMRDQLEKIRRIRAMLDRVNPACDVEVDGGVDAVTAPLVKEAGANVLVAGSAVFRETDRAAIQEKLRNG